MARIIAVANQKGGVGQDHDGGEPRRRVVTGAAPRCCWSTSIRRATRPWARAVDKRQLAHSITEVLLGECQAAEAIVKTGEGYDLLPANIDLTAAELQLDGRAGREAKLKTRSHRAERYDYILVDCPPSLSLLTLNALARPTACSVPMQCEYYALEGLSSLMDTIEALKQRLNPRLKIFGVVRTMFDVRNNLANAVSGELTRHFGDIVFRSIIPRNVRLAEAPSHGQSIVGYDKASRGGVAYMGLAGEIVRREREEQKLDKETA
jgi:chromosome partitioning protein